MLWYSQHWPWIIQTSDVEGLDFQIAQMLDKTQFDRVFMTVKTRHSTLVHIWEFAVFYYILWGFNNDVLRIAGDSSSSIKASNFTTHFIQPPFFSGNISHNLQYQQYVLPHIFFFITTNIP